MPRRTVASTIAVVVACCMLLAPHAHAEPEMSQRQREAIEYALQNRVNDLVAQKNDSGRTYRRGTFSREFRHIDDGTYVVSFMEETAGDTSLTTDRYSVTLTGKPGSDKWAVTDSELKDTYEGLVRSMPRDETFRRFDALELDLEGLKVSVSAGSLFLDYFDGEVSSITLTGKIDWSYAPPAHADAWTHAVDAYFKSTETGDFLFGAERVRLSCTPQRCADVLQSIVGLKEASKEGVDDTLKDAYLEIVAKLEDRRKDDPFSGFRPREEADHSSLRVSIKRAGSPDHFFWLDHDNFDGWDVHVGASRFGSVLGYYSERVAAGAIPGDLDRRQDGSALFYQVQGVEGTIELALEDAQTMIGDVTVTLLAKRDLDRVAFSLSRPRQSGGARAELRDPTLVLNGIYDGEGRALTWSKRGSASAVVALAETVRAGDSIALRVHWVNEGAILKIFPSYSRLPRQGWLPFVRFGDLIDNFDLTVKIPRRYTALGVGHKVMDETRGDVNVTRWTSESPLNFPTVIFGDYIDAEPKFKATTTSGAVIPVKIYGDVDGMRSWDVRARQLTPIVEAAANSLNLYREIFGVDYPFAKLDLVNDPARSFSAQSPASIVYVGGAVFRGSGAITDGALSKFNVSVIPHEVAHQWWGSLITNANQRNYWFVESLAEYASALFIEALYGRKDAQKGLKAYRDHVKGWRTEILESPMWGSVHGTYDINVGGGGTSIYNKGPYAFHMLRTTFGNDKLDAFLRNLATTLKGKEITTDDIQRVAEASFGGDMTWFFDQWIRGVGIPRYTFEYDMRRTEDGNYLVQGTVRQQVVMGEEEWVVPDLFYRAVGYVTVSLKGGETKVGPFLIEGPETTNIVFKVAEKPSHVDFNKYGEILAHDIVVVE